MTEKQITFGTSGWRAERDAFTKRRVTAVGAAFRDTLMQEYDSGRVVIGYDTRPRSQTIAEQLAGTVAKAFDTDIATRPVPTPVVAWHASNDPTVIGGMVATASHNPPSYNGIKLIDSRGFDADDRVTARVETAANDMMAALNTNVPQISQRADLITPYVEAVTGRFEATLGSLTIVYDALHGAGSTVLPRILRGLGAEVRTIRNTPNVGLDGITPNPAQATLSEVKQHLDTDADIAFVSDCDADRVRVLTPDGPVGASRLLAVIYDYQLSSGRNGPLVRTVSTGSLADAVAEEHDEAIVETSVGFKHVARAVERHDAVVGGEVTDGYCHPSHLYNKDGLFTAALVSVAASEEGITDRLSQIEEHHGRRFTAARTVDSEPTLMQSVMEHVPDALHNVLDETVARMDRTDGHKLYLEDGAWVLVRPSGTEPLIRIRTEAAAASRAESVADTALQAVRDIQADL